MPCRSRFSLPGIASENAFHCESRRLITFEKWEITHPVSPVKLAQDGFFFTEIDDVVACNFCRLFASASRIAPGIVRAFHSEHSPGCPVVTQTDLLNIPLPNYGLAYPNCALHNVQETNANWDMDVNDIVGVWGPNLRIRRRAFNLQRAPVTRGLYPKYAPIDVRRNTFAFFPNGHLDVRCIECLAESGFFCIGKNTERYNYTYSYAD